MKKAGGIKRQPALRTMGISHLVQAGPEAKSTPWALLLQTPRGD